MFVCGTIGTLASGASRAKGLHQWRQEFFFLFCSSELRLFRTKRVESDIAMSCVGGKNVTYRGIQSINCFGACHCNSKQELASIDFLVLVLLVARLERTACISGGRNFVFVLLF